MHFVTTVHVLFQWAALPDLVQVCGQYGLLQEGKNG